MMKSGRFILLMLTVLIPATAFAQTFDFEGGLDGWKASGKVRIAHHEGPDNKNAVVITGSGSLERSFPVSPLSIVQFGVKIRAAGTGSGGHAFIRFYDSAGRPILQYQGKTVTAEDYEQTGYYTEAPPLSRSARIIISKDFSGQGSIYIKEITVELNVEKPAVHPPECDLDRYMRPFWNSDTIFNETMLLLQKTGQEALGRLMYTPEKILAVKSYDLKTAYTEGKDYVLKGDTVFRTRSSAIPFRTDSSFDHRDLAWYNLQSQWVVVTYTHKDTWKGPVPVYKGSELPKTLAALKSKSPLTVVFYGMSITRGMDVSGYDHIPPYMPGYAKLFARQLGKGFDNPYITLYNAGLPGATAEWGAKYAERYVNPLHPKLVILDFGMNDFWKVTPGEFETYINTMIRKIRRGNPGVEFILLSNLRFDPKYVSDSDRHKASYLENFNGYRDVLRKMETGGMAFLDLTSLSDTIYHLKKAKDCIANPMHPNDFMARWYAQALTALFLRGKSDRAGGSKNYKENY